MAAPDAATVRGWSKIDFDALGYAADADLGVLVARSISYVEWVTGRELDSIDASLSPMSDQAVQILTETMAYQSQDDIVETEADFLLISSFNAGGYSETRRSLAELKQAGMLNANPLLNGILWALMTDDKRDEWLAWLNGTNAPAFAVTEVDWQGGGDFIGGRGSLPADPWPPITS